MKAKIIDMNRNEHTIDQARNSAFKRANRRISQPLGMKTSVDAQKHVPTMELFQREDCAQSHAVRKHLSSLGLDFIAHNVTASKPLKHKLLTEMGGKDEIPFIVDHTSGIKLYGASAIRGYLQTEYGAEPPTLLADVSQTIADRIKDQADRIAWAVTLPWERIGQLRTDAVGSFETLRGAFVAVKEAVQANVKKFREADASEEPLSKVRPSA
jgi:glutathione S-transferase